MKPSRLLRWPALTLLPLAVAGSASAQYRPAYPLYSQPAVSPYLNLLRAGAPPGINYYGIVQPEVQFRAGLQQVGLQTSANQQAIAGLQSPTALPATGHAVGFQNHLGYFQNIGAPGQSFGGALGQSFGGALGQSFGGTSARGAATSGGGSRSAPTR